ncbi:MAG: hypothetical protein QOF31_5727, partial [Mycobacterium sp.]|nr:hypothetical protein [Mycobacterium sp.]
MIPIVNPSTVKGQFVITVHNPTRKRSLYRWCVAIAAIAAIATAVAVTISRGVASAAQPTVGLGTAAPFAVLAGSAVTNTGP